MCTLIVAWAVFDDAPVVVAANRDEAVDRPSTPPRRREGGREDDEGTGGGGGGAVGGREGTSATAPPGVVAPRDERAGGTWIGYNDAGVFAGLSNRWSDRELAGERSRGHLVDAALEHRDAGSAVRAVEDALAAAEYDGFNLVVADAGAAILLEWDGRLSISEFDPGVHVVMNAGYDATFHAVPRRSEAARAQAESAAKVREALFPEPGESAEDWLDRAEGVLGDHDYGVCVHGDVSEPRSDGQPDADASGAGFGTRSSSLIALRADGTATYRFADGPPCVTPFEPVEVAPVEPDRPPEGQS